MIRVIKHWWFSLFLFLAYLALFHIWLSHGSIPNWMTTSAGLLLIGVVLRCALSRRYFASNYDLAFHGTVILDLALEGFWIPLHEGYSFYACAAAFVAVVGGYRFFLLHPRWSKVVRADFPS